MTTKERAALAYNIATGGTLPADPDAVTWALACLSTAHVSSAQRRAAEVVAEYLDAVIDDADTRGRLGLEVRTWPAWCGRGLYLTRDDFTAARSVAGLDSLGWSAWTVGDCAVPNGYGPETGTAGMDAAEAALRRAGVLAEGVTVRRPGGVA